MPNRVSTVAWLETLGQADLPQVGGKNASLGEMVRHLGCRGVDVPAGFATTAEAYWRFVESGRLFIVQARPETVQSPADRRMQDLPHRIEGPEAPHRPQHRRRGGCGQRLPDRQSA